MLVSEPYPPMHQPGRLSTSGGEVPLPSGAGWTSHPLTGSPLEMQVHSTVASASAGTCGQCRGEGEGNSNAACLVAGEVVVASLEQLCNCRRVVDFEVDGRGSRSEELRP